MSIRDGDPLYGNAFRDESVPFQAISAYSSGYMPVNEVTIYSQVKVLCVITPHRADGDCFRMFNRPRSFT